MRSLLAIVVLGFLAVPVAAAPAGFDQDPLLVVRFDTVTIAGQQIRTQVVLHTGGAVEIVDVAGTGPAITSRAAASEGRLAALQQALSAGRVGSVRGGCGRPIPDGPVEYHITWYGRGGVRFNSFRVGADPTGCPAGTERIVDALAALLLEVYTSPDTQVFPRFSR
ncbi:MAG TPA: hypothetical protein VEW48_09210 [Thermoanaerobaculia bacterium]|nr:hypothetical protein [Thermoanaerobaculia bacterium]